jgi:hypothetical protein
LVDRVRAPAARPADRVDDAAGKDSVIKIRSVLRNALADAERVDL